MAAMDTETQDMPPGGAWSTPSSTSLKVTLELVVPRSLLGLLAAPDAHRAGTGRLAHGRLNFQALSDRIQALVAGLQPGPPQRLPLTARPAARGGEWPESGLAVVFAAAPDEAPPTGPAPCEAWLARHAPEFRLACNSLRPDVALLWLGSDGRAQAWLRQGDAWAAVADRAASAAGSDSSDASAHRPAWRPFASVRLPGAQMLTIHRSAAGEVRWPWPADPGSNAAPDPVHAQPPMLTPGMNEPAEPDRAGRYSRLAAALSAPVLARLQALRFAVVGCDRSGSMLAHSLGRMGASLLLLDPARMTPESLDADLPALHEGQAKPVALQHLLRGLLRPGARCDARALSASSPAAGQLLAETDVVLCCTSRPEAQRWAQAWALALLKPLLVLQTGRTGERLWAELWLLPPGTGCLQCRGVPRAGLPISRTPGDLPHAAPRSWQGVAAHAALRLLEQHLAGRVPGGLRRHLEEDLDSARWTATDTAWGARDAVTCPACRLYQGTGLKGLRTALDSGGLGPSTTPIWAP